MAEEILLASSIANVPQLAAFDQMAAHRYNQAPIERLLVYIIDTVEPSALPWLAKQFDVLGYKGMRLATTEAQQRAVIKNAIQIKRYSGTPWAVKQALRSIGYPDAILTENAGTGAHGWAEFQIQIDAGENGISEAMITELVEMIKIYKGTRNHLLAIEFTVNFSDGITVTDDNNLLPGTDDLEHMIVGVTRFANGAYIADGSIDASSDSDSLTMNVITL